jgi:hypothetical protein
MSSIYLYKKPGSFFSLLKFKYDNFCLIGYAYRGGSLDNVWLTILTMVIQINWKKRYISIFINLFAFQISCNLNII